MRNTSASLLGALVLGGAALIAGLAPARAQSYPTRVVRLVVPQTPGGTTDILARHVAERLSRLWGQRVVVENIAGASGNVGLQTVARSEPDGYTLLMTDSGPLAVNPHVNRNVTFDARKELQPIGPIATSGFYVFVGKGSPFASISQLLGEGRTGPSLNYATSGAGSVNHIIGETLRIRSGAKLAHVAYRGIAPAIAGVMGGHVDLGVSSSPSLMGQITSKEVKPLAYSSGERSRLTPEVPTLREAGQDIVLETWWGVLGPASLGAELVSRISRDLETIAADPSFASVVEALGAVSMRQSPAEFARQIEADIERWGVVVAATGARVE